MAWEATYLLAPVLLVLLVSDSREQEPALVLLQKLEGETISLTCPYWGRKDSYMVKIWCKKTSENSCNKLVTSPRSWAQKSRYSIQDERRFSYFNVTMTGLRTADSGFYDCGIYDSSQSVVYIRRSFRLMYLQGCAGDGLQASTLSTTRSTVTTTVRASATSLSTDRSSFPSPPDNWKFVVSGVVVVVLLLLVLTILMILYLRKARGRAGKGEDESHITDDLSAQKEETTGFEQQMGSEEDTGDIQYATLTHLNRFGTEDSIYANTHFSWKPMPDPLLFVEYASIARNKPQPS